MSSVKDFILEDLSVLEETEEITFPQFVSKETGKVVPWKIKAINAVKFEEIRKNSTRRITNRRTGQVTTETDTQRFEAELIANAVIVPNLNNDELQKAYGTQADPAGTARKMLKAGQYAELGQRVQALSGFDLDDLVEEVKN
jgi:hypothetical protein